MFCLRNGVSDEEEKIKGRGILDGFVGSRETLAGCAKPRLAPSVEFYLADVMTFSTKNV